MIVNEPPLVEDEPSEGTISVEITTGRASSGAPYPLRVIQFQETDSKDRLVLLSNGKLYRSQWRRGYCPWVEEDWVAEIEASILQAEEMERNPLLSSRHRENAG